MFGATAGIQCSCNALYAICWTTIKQIGYWNMCDLDYILINKGDELFKQLNLMRYLDVDGLPNS